MHQRAAGAEHADGPDRRSDHEPDEKTFEEEKSTHTIMGHILRNATLILQGFLLPPGPRDMIYLIAIQLPLE
jgi:hypothetical protein